MMKYRGIFLLITIFITSSAFAADVEISQLPIDSAVAAKPNIIFALDDSGSMDSEVIFYTNDGALWWNTNLKSFVDGNGIPLFNEVGSADSTWKKYVYLFPNGTGTSQRTYSDSTHDHYAIPPIPAYAYARSPDYNLLYYNTFINYKSWEPAYINGNTVTFNNSNSSAAKSHPVLPVGGTPLTMNLTQNIFSQNANWTFRMHSGMVIPGATISGITGRRNGNGSFNNITFNFTIPNGEFWEVAIPYYPATFYLKDETCTSGLPNCATAPDGALLRRYEIKNGNTFPSGRTYAEEMQNFANWFTYYRKRKLMLSQTMGEVLSNIQEVRGGIVLFNRRNTVTMYDFSNANNNQNAKALIGIIYTNPADSGTPTRDVLNFIGGQFQNNNSIIQYGCQVNSAMILTDGFANVTNVTPPSYNATTFGNGAPYTPIYSPSLADIALSYYTINLRPDLPEGLVPVEDSSAGPNPDINPNLHMNTFALTLGTKGTIFGTEDPSTTNPFTTPPAWPNPDENRSPTAVDDLWHATINGRGAMYNATDPVSIITSLQELFASILIRAGSGAAVAVANSNINTTNNTVYAASYNSRYGELIPLKVNLTTGALEPDPNPWSARALLNTRDNTNRFIATYNGSQGIPFQWDSMSATMQSKFHSKVVPPGPNDGSKIINYLRGSKADEGTLYRPRTYLLGDIVHAEPVVVIGATASYGDTGYAAFKTSIANRTPMIYQGANDGFMHAFNAATGQEVWAYIPKLVMEDISDFASKTYNHRFYVDSTPWVGDAYVNNTWKTMLIGGLGAGGKGYYALDITSPEAANEADAVAKVMWEFPNDNTAANVANTVGLTFGRPILAKTNAYGWVVLVTSGYNNKGDGKGHLYVLDPATGNVLKDMVTTAGSVTTPSGLAHISAYAENREFDATIDYVYGGDLLGNVWRFDLSDANSTNWTVAKLATLVDGSGNPQPITSAPELSEIDGKRIVYVGTGKLLGVSDLLDTQQNSFYALVDDKSSNPEITPLRSSLAPRTVSGNSVTGNAVDYSTQKGWYIDFPLTRERLNNDPVLAFGSILFTTNVPSGEACSSTSYLYLLNQETGLELPAENFADGNAWAVKQVANTLTNRPVIVTLPNNKGVAIIHNADDTSSVLEIPTTAGKIIDAKAWKKVLIEN